MDDIIEKYALQNAIKFDGNARVGAVIGACIQEKPKLKDKLKELSAKVREIVMHINELSVEEQTAKLEAIAPELLEKKEKKKKDLPELPNAVPGKVVTRIPPEPSKYNHIGHALSFLLNYIYAKRYKGKSILRFEDTNPAAAKQEYVDAMKQDVLEYLDIKPDKTVFVSDDMATFYELAEKLINKKDAYVCFCDRDKMKELREKGNACDCRRHGTKKNLEEWKNMLDRKYLEGKAVLRLKGDMKSKNYVMRDPVIFRIALEKHYRQKDKYAVWPMYDFENAVEEHLCGITHILRSSEFGLMRIELQNYIKDLLGFKKQTVVQYGRFNIVGAVTQGREIRELIEKKQVSGWDDPSLVTLRALKRRGIIKEMFYELVKEVGLSKTPTNIDWTRIAAINRRLLDQSVNRYFFIEDPVKIKIEGAPKQNIQLKLHPDHPKRGYRNFKTHEEFYITKKDLKELEYNKLYRLMDCLNFRKSKDFKFDSTDYHKYKMEGEKIMHWLPVSKDNINIEVLMPDHSIIKGIGENSISKLEEGDIIQAERFGFIRLDEKTKTKLKFWFTHK
ncbi:MAG: glutamate--tRNA ligase [archaeon]